MMKLVNMAKSLVKEITGHWKKPKEGEYVSYKEFTYLVLGIGGNMCAASASYNLTFSAGCMFVGAIYGLRMMDFAILGVVNLVFNYIFSPINMIITDNLGSPSKKTMRMINWANLLFLVLGIAAFFVPQEPFEQFMPALPQVIGSKFLLQVFSTYYNIFVYRKFSPKFGKYRCWIIANTIPYMLSLMLLVLFPYNSLDYNNKFWVMHFFFSFWGCFGSCFSQTGNIQNVISPNTDERAKIMSYGSFLWSLFPSIYNIIFPVFATLAGGMTSINTYRIVVPVIILIFAPFSLFLIFGVKDRVIQEHDHRPQVDMKNGFKAVLKNKYLWITNISSWLSSLSAGIINIINMVVIYSMRQDWVMGITSTILGTACVPGMFLAPTLIKKFGKKRIILFCKYASVACLGITGIGVYLDSLLIIILSSYVSSLFNSVVSIANSAITADIWDYQQYISGERLDGCMGIFGYISAPLTTLTAMLVPFLYGLVGFTSDWNILYDSTIRTEVFLITVVVSAVAGLLATIPYHFYDFTEKRHEKIMDELRERALEIEQDQKTDGVNEEKAAETADKVTV